MGIDKCVRLGIIVCMAVCLLVGMASSAAAIGKGAPPELNPLGNCATPNDDGIIGQVQAKLGEAVAIPVYIGSDDCIYNYKLSFIIPPEVDYDSVVLAACPLGLDSDMPRWEDSTRTLTVEHSNGGTCYTPDINDVFLYIWVNTHCKELQDFTADVVWPADDPDAPEIYLGHDDCNRDPLSLTDGSVYIEPVNIAFDISAEVGLIGDSVTVTVTCNNDYELKAFIHRLAYDPAVLALANPFFDQAPRADGAIMYGGCEASCLTVYGVNDNGFGLSDEVGAELYYITFKIISPVDDITGAVWFEAPDSTHDVWALDCEQKLEEFANVTYGTGSVTVPPYLATFDIGEAVWSNENLCEFTVPLYLQNNFTVTNFRIAMKYIDDLGADLYFDDLISVDDLYWPMTGDDQECTIGGYRYGELETYGTISIPPSEDLRKIGDLVFHLDNVSPGVTTDYLLEAINSGCDGDYDTWVRTYDEVRLYTDYQFADVQTVFDPGSIITEDGLIWINLPGVNGTCDKWGENCEYRESTSFNVKSNVDLDILTFAVPWSNDDYCVRGTDLQPGVAVEVNADSTEALITIYDITASADWKWYGCLEFTNAEYNEVWGDIWVEDIAFTETCASQVTPTSTGSAGGLHLEALPISVVSCQNLSNGGIARVTAVPDRFELLPNHPNPFNASTTIEFNLSEPAHTTLEVYNVTGQRVNVLLDAYTEAGRHSVWWDGTNAQGDGVASGMYFYRLRSGNLYDTKKMVLMK